MLIRPCEIVGLPSSYGEYVLKTADTQEQLVGIEVFIGKDFASAKRILQEHMIFIMGRFFRKRNKDGYVRWARYLHQSKSLDYEGWNSFFRKQVLVYPE